MNNSGAYCGRDQEPDKHDAPIRVQAASDGGLRERFADDARGLPVSLRSFLQNLHVQTLVSNQSLEPRVLFLKCLQLLHNVVISISLQTSAPHGFQVLVSPIPEPRPVKILERYRSSLNIWR